MFLTDNSFISYLAASTGTISVRAFVMIGTILQSGEMRWQMELSFSLLLLRQSWP